MAKQVVYWRDRFLGFVIGTILAIFLLPVVTYGFNFSFPVSWWFSFGEIYVHDTFEGKSPVVSLDPEVRRQFVGDWVLKVYRMVDDGHWRTVCTKDGKGDYRPDVPFVIGSTLDTLLSSLSRSRCPKFVPGHYVLTLAMVVQPSGMTAKVARADPAAFTVIPAP